MTEFFGDLTRYGFLQYALIMGLLASVACGVVGTFVVARKITYIAAGIAHSVLGGMGAAKYFATVYQLDWLHPLYGAAVAALLAAGIIGVVSLRAREREDTTIGAVWAIGMAIGVIFITKTPGYTEDLMSYLFGNILMISAGDLWVIGLLDLAVVGVAFLFYHQLSAVCFDEEFARVRGINVELYYILLLCLVALTVVILVTVVGLILVIALLTLPVAIAGRFSRTMARTMVLAIGVSGLLTTGGLAASYQPDFPAGATIILLSGLAYIIVIAFTHRKRSRA